MTAKDIMTTEVVSIAEDASVATAARLMHETGHGGLPVIGATGDLLGMVDRLRLLHLVLPKYAEDIGDLAFLPSDFKPFEARLEEIGRLPVRKVMEPCEVCANEETPVVELAALMLVRREHHVPIVRGRRLVGIIGLGDIVDEIVWPHFKRGENE